MAWSLAQRLRNEIQDVSAEVRTLVSVILTASDTRTFCDGEREIFGYPPSVISVGEVTSSMDVWTREISVGDLDVVFRNDGALRDLITGQRLVGKGIEVQVGVRSAEVTESDFATVWRGSIDDYKIASDGTVTLKCIDPFGELSRREITGAWINKHPLEIILDIYKYRARVSDDLYDETYFDSRNLAQSLSHLNMSYHTIRNPTGASVGGQAAAIYADQGRRPPHIWEYDLTSGALFNEPQNAWEVVSKFLSLLYGAIQTDSSGRHIFTMWSATTAASLHLYDSEFSSFEVSSGKGILANRVRVDFGSSGLTFGVDEQLEIDDNRHVEFSASGSQTNHAYPGESTRIIDKKIDTDMVRTIFRHNDIATQTGVDTTDPLTIKLDFTNSYVGLTGARWRGGYTEGTDSYVPGPGRVLATISVSVTSNVATISVSTTPYSTVATTAVTVSSNIATATVAAGHQLEAGTWITTNGHTADASTPVQIISVTATTVVYPLTAADGALADGTGTIRVNHGVRPGDYITTEGLTTDISIPVPVTSVTEGTITVPLTAGDGAMADGVGVIHREQDPGDQIGIPTFGVTVSSNVATATLPTGHGLVVGNYITTFGHTTNATDVAITAVTNGAASGTISYPLTAADGPLADGTGYVRPQWRRGYLRWGDEVLRIAYLEPTYSQSNTSALTLIHPVRTNLSSGAQAVYYGTDPRETTPYALNVTLERAQLSTTAASHLPSEAIYDITIPYMMGAYRITRHQEGAAEASVSAPLTAIGLQIGDQITGDFGAYAGYSKDGADNTTYWEISSRSLKTTGEDRGVDLGLTWAKQTAEVSWTPVIGVISVPSFWAPRLVTAPQTFSLVGLTTLGGAGITIADNSSFNWLDGAAAFSITGWIERRAATWSASANTVIARMDGGQEQFAFGTQSGGKLRLAFNGPYAQNSTTLAAQTVYHFAFCYDAGTVTIYIDGVSTGVTTSGSIPATLATSSSALYGFCQATGTNLCTDYRIANLALYDSVLTQSEVNDIYFAGRVVDLRGFPNLMAWWRFNGSYREELGQLAYNWGGISGRRGMEYDNPIP